MYGTDTDGFTAVAVVATAVGAAVGAAVVAAFNKKTIWIKRFKLIEIKVC